jgi:hypothetical protein
LAGLHDAALGRRRAGSSLALAAPPAKRISIARRWKGSPSRSRNAWNWRLALPPAASTITSR